jgi:hypothetical protein
MYLHILSSLVVLQMAVAFLSWFRETNILSLGQRNAGIIVKLGWAQSKSSSSSPFAQSCIPSQIW